MSINTTCKFCIFNKRDENGVQIGCNAGMLEKWKSREKATLNENDYLIEDLCLLCKNKESFPNLTLEEAKEMAYPTCSAFINIDLFRSNLDFFIDYFKDKKYKRVHFVGNLEPVQAAEIYMKYNDKIKGLIVHSLATLDFEDFIISRIDVELNKKIRYFHIFDADIEKTNLLEELNDLMINKLNKVILLYQKNNPSFIVNCYALSIYCKKDKNINNAISNIYKDSKGKEGIVCVSQQS